MCVGWANVSCRRWQCGVLKHCKAACSRRPQSEICMMSRHPWEGRLKRHLWEGRSWTDPDAALALGQSRGRVQRVDGSSSKDLAQRTPSG